MDSAPDAIIAVDRDMNVLLWNPAAERLYGWRAEEVVGAPLPAIPDDLAVAREALFERLHASGTFSSATRHRRKDGSLIDVRVDVSGLRDADGALIGSMGIVRDVTEEQAAQRRVAERARLVRRLNDVVADINAELDLTVVLDRISESLTELTGADAGGFVLVEGDRLRIVSLTGMREELRGTTATLRGSLVGELLVSGKSVLVSGADQRPLTRLFRAEMPGLHTMALALSHVQGRSYGALYALFATPDRGVGDVELEVLELLAWHAGVALANALAYEEVVRQRAHERAVIDASADGIAVLDEDGLVRQWNPAAHELTGLASEEVIGKPLPFPFPEPGSTLDHQLPSGRWLGVLSTEIADTRERVVDFRDISEAKALDEAKDLFLATASHELRTPITVVQGFSRTLVNRWDKLSDVDRRGAVKTIADRASALARLVEHLLLGSRAGREEIDVTNAPFDLADVLRGAALAFRPLSDRHTLVLDVPENLPTAFGDALATDVIVGQLLENAFKYSPAGGMVAVRARAEDGCVVLSVEDEGVGITSEDRERVFERFFQGDAGDRRRFGGIGLGLFIVRRLALAQDGEVSAHAREGGGTEMRLVLRRADAPRR